MYRAQKTLIPDTGSTCTTCPLPPQSFLPPLQKGLFLHSALHLHTARHRAWTAGKAAPHRTQGWNCQLIQLPNSLGTQQAHSDLHPLQEDRGGWGQPSYLAMGRPHHFQLQSMWQPGPCHHFFFSPHRSLLANHKNRSLSPSYAILTPEIPVFWSEDQS